MDNKKSEPLAGLSFGYLLRIQDAMNRHGFNRHLRVI